jgi:hypothetical protein
MSLTDQYAALDRTALQGFIGQQCEHLLLDFKTVNSASFNRDDRRSLACALSGFANSSGGLIVWGVDARSPDIITDLPPNHRLGGISGGPLIGWFETPGHLAYYVLSGIISEAHQELENVVAVRADYICDDGSIAEPQPGV